MNVGPERIPDELIDQAAAQFEDLHPAEYDRYRKALVELAKIQGADKFSLLQGLREPRNAREKNLLEFYAFQGSEDERKEIIKSHAERPVDHEMLDEFHVYVERDLHTLGDFRGAVVMAANECEQFHDPRAGRNHERAAQIAYECLCDKSEMYSTELIACGEFLGDLNCKQGRGVVEIGATAANSYHELVSRIAKYVKESWKSCCNIASNSQHGFRYAYEASASSLFKQSSFESIPQPQRLYAHVEDEYRRAKLELRDIHADLTATVGDPLLNQLMWPAACEMQLTESFREERHDPLVDRLLGYLESQLPAGTRLSNLQSLQDRGCDLLVEWSNGQKDGVQLKSNGDVEESGFSQKTVAQIQHSRQHGLRKFYLVFAADITRVSNSQKVRGMISTVSAMNDPYVATVPPERAWKLLLSK